MEISEEKMTDSGSVAPGRSAVKFWNADKILSLSAFGISLATFILLLYQTRLANEQNQLARKQQFASVLPYLQIGDTSPERGEFRLMLVNNGIGPAFIKKITTRYQGKSYALDPAGFILKVIYPTDKIQFYYAGLFPGRVLPAGQEIELIGVKNSPADADKLRKLFVAGDAEIELEYGSVYGESWRLTSSGNVPVPLSVPEE